MAQLDDIPVARVGREVRRSPIEIVASDADLEERAISTWLEKYDDQTFSLTDAVSFEMMKTRRIRYALTLDAHFITAGFSVVP
jgi:predicted nucleic acid-binding protein